MNILFLNAGRRCELLDAFRMALQRHGGGKIFASDISEYAPALYRADQVLILPHSSADNFADVLGKFCQENEIDLLVPTIDPDLENLDLVRNKLTKLCPECKLLLSPSYTIKHSQDKRLGRDLFAKLGAEVPVPIDAESVKFEFPIFVKPAKGSASEGAREVNSPEELLAAQNRWPDLMLEKIVSGPEYTVDVLCDFSGEVLLSVPRRRLKVRGGEVSQGIVELNPKLEKLAASLAKGFQCKGPVTLQFRQPEPGRFVAMELNARMGGGLPLTIAAGADWPAHIIDLCDGEAPSISREIRNGMMMSRYDSSQFFVHGHFQSYSDKRIEIDFNPNEFTGIEAWVFDLDDTLYPESEFVFSAYRAVSEKVWLDHGIDIETDLRKMFSTGRRGDLFSMVLREKGVDFDETYVLSLVKIYRQHSPNIKPYLDTSVLSDLRNKNKKIALLTDGWSQVQRNKIRSLKIDNLFDAIVVSDELGGPEFWKPAFAPYLKVLESLDIPPENAVYVGDNPQKDFLGAKKLGMKTIRLRRHATEHEHDEPQNPQYAPDAEINALTELRRVFH